MLCKCDAGLKLVKKKGSGKLINLIAAALFLLTPKCAMCWAAYLGIFGLTGFSALAYRSWFMPVSIALFCLTLAHLLWRAVTSRSYLPFLLALAAAIIIGWQKWSGNPDGWGIMALVLMSLAWLIDVRGNSGASLLRTYLQNKFFFKGRVGKQ